MPETTKEIQGDEAWIARLLLNSHNLVAVILDNQGVICRFSQGAEQLSGFTSAEAVGKHIWDMVPESSDQNRLRRLFAIFLKRGSFPQEYIIHWQGKDKKDIWLNFAASDHQSGDDSGCYIFIGHDFTRQKQVEQRLQAKLREQKFLADLSRSFVAEGMPIKEKYTAALASLGQFLEVERVFFHTITPKGLLIEETFEYAAPGFTQVGVNMDKLPLDMLGMHPDKLLLTTPIAYARAEDYLKHFSHLADFWRLLSSKSHMAQPMFYQDKMLGFISVHACRAPREWSGEDKLLLELVTDIFESAFLWNREAKSLRELQELWSFALEGSGEGVFEWDFETGVTNYDKRWKQMLGIEETEKLNSNEDFIAMVHPDDRTTVLEDEIAQMLASGRFAARFRMRHRDGEYRFILSRGIVVTWRGEGMPKKIVGTHLDITEQVRQEQENYEARRYREEFEKVASLGTMVAGVAHEINQPLQAMKMTVDGTLYWQKKGKDLPKEKLLGDYQLLSTQISRIDRIIRRLRKFIVQGRAAVMQETSVSSCIEGALEVVGNQLRSHGVLIECELAPQLPPVWGDPERLEEAIVNLMVNAMQAMDKPGVSSRVVRVVAGALPTEESVFIEVQDTGPGVPQEMLERLFEPFVSSKIETNARSMGLGLSIVRSTVLAMNGTVSVCNRNKNGGACFRMVFPCLRRDA